MILSELAEPSATVNERIHQRFMALWWIEANDPSATTYAPPAALCDCGHRASDHRWEHGIKRCRFYGYSLAGQEPCRCLGFTQNGTP